MHILLYLFYLIYAKTVQKKGQHLSKIIIFEQYTSKVFNIRVDTLKSSI
jgi:hypothetical protein